LAAAERHAAVEAAVPDARPEAPALAAGAAVPDVRLEEPALAAVEALAWRPAAAGQPGPLPAWVAVAVVAAQALPRFSSASIPEPPAWHRELSQHRPSCGPSWQAFRRPASSVQPRSAERSVLKPPEMSLQAPISNSDWKWPVPRLMATEALPFGQVPVVHWSSAMHRGSHSWRVACLTPGPHQKARPAWRA